MLDPILRSTFRVDGKTVYRKVQCMHCEEPHAFSLLVGVAEEPEGQ